MVEVDALVAGRGDEDDAALLRVAGGRRDRLDDRLLLLVVAAVEQPRIGEEAHVHDVEVLVTRVAQRVDDRLGEEVPRGGAGLEHDYRRLRRDAGHTHAVDRRGDRARRVSAVAGIVLQRRLVRAVATRHLLGGISCRRVGVEEDARRGQSTFGMMSVLVRSMPVSMSPTRTPVATVRRVRAVRRRADRAHVPLACAQRLRSDVDGDAVQRCACRRLGGSALRPGRCRLCTLADRQDGDNQPCTCEQARHPVLLHEHPQGCMSASAAGAPGVRRTPHRRPRTLRPSRRQPVMTPEPLSDLPRLRAAGVRRRLGRPSARTRLVLRA